MNSSKYLPNVARFSRGMMVSFIACPLANVEVCWGCALSAALFTGSSTGTSRRPGPAQPGPGWDGGAGRYSGRARACRTDSVLQLLLNIHSDVVWAIRTVSTPSLRAALRFPSFLPRSSSFLRSLNNFFGPNLLLAPLISRLFLVHVLRRAPAESRDIAPAPRGGAREASGV